MTLAPECSSKSEFWLCDKLTTNSPLGEGPLTHSSNWDNLPKPWTIDQCRDRYVMGTRIGLRLLSQLSGVPFSTIAVASRDSQWGNQRNQFRSKTDGKTIDIVSSQIAGQTAKIFQDHYAAELEVFEVGKNIVSLAKLYTQSIRDRFQQLIENTPDDAEVGDQPKGNAYELQALTSSLKSAQDTIEGAINGQRRALGLDYSDINYAVSSVRRAGLEVVEKDEFELFKQYLTAQASTQNSEVSGTAAVEISTLEVVPSRESTDSSSIE